MSFFSKIADFFKGLFGKKKKPAVTVTRYDDPGPVDGNPLLTTPVVKLEPEAELPKALWRGPMKRPPEDSAGWEEFEFKIANLGTFKNMRWRNPGNGKVEWVDYPPANPISLDWLFIAQGHQDVGAPIWNGLATDIDMINEARGPKGMERIKNYKGTLRSNPYMWPPEARTAYFRSHKT